MADVKTRLRYRLHSILTGLLLVTLAILVAWLSTRYPLQADWTRSGRHTLSEASVAILERATDKLEVSAYAREQSDLRRAVRRFVEKYRRVKPDITLHFINPDAVPNEVRRLGIKVNGELVLHYQGRTEHVRTASEREFTHAVQRLVRGGQRWLAFVSGHGERDPEGKANYDLGDWGRQLRDRGFRIQSFNLGDTGAVPDNTAALVIASPQVPFLPGEVELVRQYLEAGGNLLWLRDPDEKDGLQPLAEYLQIGFGPGTVIDPSGRGLGINDPTITVVPPRLYGHHAVVEDFAFTTLFPGAVSITHQGQRWQATTLLQSNDSSWLETGELQGQVSLDPDNDTPGPLTLGLALTRRSGEDDDASRRVAVVGDGDFLSNTYIANAGNLDLGMRLANWLSSDDDLIDVPTHTVEDTRLQMSPVLAGSAGLFFMFLLPLLLLAVGGVIGWRRKKR